ncbi:hypothetical protein Tco_1511925 [Tanacetum coccineum]
MEFFLPNSTQRVLDLENTQRLLKLRSLQVKTKVKIREEIGSKLTSSKDITSYRTARIVSSNEASLGDQEDASKHRRKIDDIDKDAEITLVDETQGRYGNDLMFDTNVLDDEEVFVAEQGVSNKYVNLSVDEVTLAQALAALKKERIEREKAEANIDLKETWDDIQAKIKADQLLAKRLQAREQEELTIKERAILFQQLLEKKKKTLCSKKSRRKEKRTTNKSSTNEYHVYLFEKHGRMEAQRFEEQVFCKYSRII